MKALQTVCTDEWLEKLGFQANELGQVKDEYGVEILPRGFLTGLKKILGEIDE
ncbi:gamma-mobile-trio protein GmtX [Providencia sp. PROV170]|uniref:gamma-mobile-trio protein GmtX n=1 Tax=Providencia sp. PROV170 TaxID=2936792 RepID=UPI00298F6783|nr:gamma-mobile-trio protein GmtX [Providencia sp. PROV170]